MEPRCHKNRNILDNRVQKIAKQVLNSFHRSKRVPDRPRETAWKMLTNSMWTTVYNLLIIEENWMNKKIRQRLNRFKLKILLLCENFTLWTFTILWFCILYSCNEWSFVKRLCLGTAERIRNILSFFDNSVQFKGEIQTAVTVAIYIRHISWLPLSWDRRKFSHFL